MTLVERSRALIAKLAAARQLSMLEKAAKAEGFVIEAVVLIAEMAARIERLEVDRVERPNAKLTGAP